ncbi:hypothetical protein QNJ28_10525 [Macrococcus caseolyticus]|uniref:hypothetical protein n=1 Tax=Macrococcoides caseolyticum TaxID=69966 RepID=UPI0024BD4BEC|nr:hypothetical protein [Macrococcus caseolyticus]MDJ1110491.1 hypothetical protein [Macrococcus caseolyticus]
MKKINNIKESSSSEKANLKRSKPPKKFVLSMRFWETILQILRVLNEVKDLFW